MKKFTFRRSEVGKAPFDFYSFGHLLFGYCTNFVVFSLVMFLSLSDYFLAMSFVLSLLTSVIWELLEEIILPRRMFGKDTLINSLTDIILTMIGTAVSHWWSFYKPIYLGLSIAWILITLVPYQIFWKLTK